MVDLSRLKAQLYVSGMQTENNPLFQVIVGLIDGQLFTNSNVTTLMNQNNDAFPEIISSGRVVGTSTSTSITSVTIGNVDSSFFISSNVNVIDSTLIIMDVDCDYTDETGNTNTITLISAVTTSGPSAASPVHIRVKAGTPISVYTTGTFTSTSYNAEAYVIQL